VLLEGTKMTKKINSRSGLGDRVWPKAPASIGGRVLNLDLPLLNPPTPDRRAALPILPLRVACA
jgi:hypothetical protein